MTIAQNFAAKLSVAFVAGAMIFSGFATSASAQTSEELQKMINDLLAQIAQLEAGASATTGGSACTTIMAPLTMGSTGADVTALQNRLLADGEMIPAGATGYFGNQTRAALASWQGKKAVSPAVGYYGPITKAAMDASCVPADVDDTDEDTDEDDESSAELQGEGTLATFEVDDDETEVQEGAEEIVMVLTMEAEDGDIEVTRMSFELVGTSADENDPWDVFEKVSLWVDGDMVAEFEADDEDNYLDEDAGELRFSGMNLILREDEEVEVMVTVETVNSVDSAGVDQDWTIEPTQIRYFDADGVATTDGDVDEMTDDDTTDRESFEIVEAGADDDATIESNSDTPDATTLKVEDNTSESDEYVVHIFDIEVDRDSSDLVLNDAFLDVSIVNTAAGDDIDGQDAVIAEIWMTIDGEAVEGEAVAGAADLEGAVIQDSGTDAGGTTVRYLFEFDDLDLDADEDYEVEVSVVFEGTDDEDSYANTGVTITTEVTNGALWEVEGADDDNVLTGDDMGETHTLATVVPVITGVTVSESLAEDRDSGTVSFRFNVEADGDDDITGFDVNDIIDLVVGGALDPTPTLVKTGGDATLTGPGVYTINDGDDASFALTYTFTGANLTANNGSYFVTVDSILGIEVDETSDALNLTGGST